MKKWAKNNIGFFFIIPWLIGFLVFKLYPFGSSLVYSFTDYNLFKGIKETGIMNYLQVFEKRQYREALIQDYLDCSSYIDEVIAMQTDEKRLEAAVKTKENIDGHFVKSGAADCESLQNIYGPKIENKKDDLEYLNKVVKIMSIFKCESSDAYFAAAEYAHGLQPSVQTAISLGNLYVKQREDLDKALEYYNQAIEMDDDKMSLADTYYKMANIYFSNKKYDSSRSCLQKCLANNPNKGEAYIQMANLYAVNYEWTKEDALNRCSYYAVIDKLEQAKRVDPSVADKANDLIKKYKEQTPQVDALFMLGYKPGDQVEIKGWIKETVTIR